MRHQSRFVLFAFFLSVFAALAAGIASEGLAGSDETCVPPPSDLVSWWDGDRISGTTALDLNNSNDGNMLGVSVSAGMVGDAFRFDGSSGRINAGNPQSLNFGRANPFSLEAWFMWDGGGSEINNIIRKSNYPVFGEGAGYWLRIGRDNQTLEFFVGETTGAPGLPRGVVTTPVTPAAWHHVVGTRDDSGTMSLYVDGELKGITQAPNANATSEAPFLLGAWDDRFGLIELFSGLMDEISVYNRVLTATEVRAIYDVGHAGKCKVPPPAPSPTIDAPTLSLNPDHGPPGSTFTITANGFHGGSFVVRFGDCSGNCINLVSGPCPFNGTSYTCAPTVSFTLTVPNFPPGTYSIRAGDGNFLTIPFTITAPAPTPGPVAICRDVTIESSSDCTANISIDNGSFHPSGDPFTVDQSPRGPYALGTRMVTLTATDSRGASSSCNAVVTVVDKTAPAITINAPVTGVHLLNQAVAASYSCIDACSGVATCNGSAPSGTNIDTASVGTKTFTVSSTDNAGNSANPQSLSYIVSYATIALFDQTKSKKSGSVIPIKVQLKDALGQNVSSTGILLHAVQLVQVATSASEIIDAAGSSNADLNFRFDSTVGNTGGYIFNLDTTGLTTGTYRLEFVADGDPTRHSVLFQVRQ